MMDRLEHVFETQKRFVADASHELRTPLTAIRGNAELLSIAPPEEREVCITSIRREAERMSRLVADLLLLAAADIEERPVHLQRVDLREVLEDVYRSAVVLSDGKVAVECEVRQPVLIDADPDRIKQLVLNLVDNAIKFTPPGGTVIIGLAPEAGGAEIRVTDTGIGIPEEEQVSIFRAFYRVDGARRKRGSGLGLAISAWIVAAHNGRIEVKSEPGKGSTFVVHLPASAVSPIKGESAGRTKQKRKSSQKETTTQATE
jgi:signal transduction histidine kinase